MRLNAPTKIVFMASAVLGAVAILLYLLGMFGAIQGGFASVAVWAFWIAVAAWGLLVAGTTMKGV